MLENIAKENGAKVKVVKNSLATIALKNAGIDNLNLKDNNLLVGEVTKFLPVKWLIKVAGEFKNRLVLSLELSEGKAVELSTILAMVNCRVEMSLSVCFLNVWNAPVSENFTIGLEAFGQKKSRGSLN